MIKSMTGYGLATSDYAHAKYTVEIKSLNSKFLELSLKLPKAFSDKEFLLRRIKFYVRNFFFNFEKSRFLQLLVTFGDKKHIKYDNLPE
jgi:hypothetical protein